MMTRTQFERIGSRLRRPLVRVALVSALLTPGLFLAPSGGVAPVRDAAAAEAAERALVERYARRYVIPFDLADRIHRAALEERVPPHVAFGLVSTESSFRASAVSPKGAVGYTQVLPSTAKWLVPGTSRAELFEGETNLRIGLRYLSYLLDYYEGDLRLALTAYNRGPGTVDRLLERGRDPGNGYAERVLRGRG